MLNADSSGTFLSHAFFVVSGNSYALQSLEASFQQDVNGDGRIGPLTTVIEASGSTSLVQVADAYFLYQGGGSSGPQLRLSGAYVAAGQFGAWTPIGAEQVGSVYEVAWKNGAADQYLEWTVDGSGNYITQGSVVSGSTLVGAIVRSPSSTRTSTTTGRSVLSRRRSRRLDRPPWSRSPTPSS